MKNPINEKRIAWAERLLLARTKLGLTRDQLSVSSGISTDAIRNLEEGKSVLPHLNTCTKISKALDEEIDNLFPKLSHLLENSNETQSNDSIVNEVISEFSLINYHITRDEAISEDPIWIECTLKFREISPRTYRIEEINDDPDYGHDIVGFDHDGKLYLFGRSLDSNADDFFAYYWKQSNRWVGYWFGWDWNHQGVISLALLSQTSLIDEELNHVAKQMQQSIQGLHDMIVAPNKTPMAVCRVFKGTPRLSE